MMTALLIVAALVVVVLLACTVHAMFNGFDMWLFHSVCGTVPGLCKLLGVIVVAIIDRNNE